MRAGAKGHAGIENQVDRRGIRCIVPGGHDPEALVDADRFELGLRQLHPVLLFAEGGERGAGLLGGGDHSGALQRLDGA